MTMGTLAREVKSEMFNALTGIGPSWKQNLAGILVDFGKGTADSRKACRSSDKHAMKAHAAAKKAMKKNGAKATPSIDKLEGHAEQYQQSCGSYGKEQLDFIKEFEQMEDRRFSFIMGAAVKIGVKSGFMTDSSADLQGWSVAYEARQGEGGSCARGALDLAPARPWSQPHGCPGAAAPAGIAEAWSDVLPAVPPPLPLGIPFGRCIFISHVCCRVASQARLGSGASTGSLCLNATCLVAIVHCTHCVAPRNLLRCVWLLRALPNTQPALFVACTNALPGSAEPRRSLSYAEAQSIRVQIQGNSSIEDAYLSQQGRGYSNKSEGYYDKLPKQGAARTVRPTLRVALLHST